MIEIVTDRKEIIRLHKQLIKTIRQQFDTKINCTVGFPSGSFEDNVAYSSTLDIWYSHFEHDNRFWNGFGIGRPIESSGNSLVGEINFPYEGINRRIAGAFGKETNGNILVLHRGRIGGGSPGVGKNVFVDNFRGDQVIALDGEIENNFCVVGELNSSIFPLQVADFINEIRRVKEFIKTGSSFDFEDLNNFQFTDEQSGQTTHQRQGETIRNRTHGIVVNALADELLQRGLTFGNDVNRDLFVYRKQKITTIFEIKTTSSTQNIYTAVGQLIIYSIPIKTEVKLFIVLPEKLNNVVETRLARLGIEPLYYIWRNGFPHFTELDSLIAE